MKKRLQKTKPDVTHWQERDRNQIKDSTCVPAAVPTGPGCHNNPNIMFCIRESNTVSAASILFPWMTPLHPVLSRLVLTRWIIAALRLPYIIIICPPPVSPWYVSAVIHRSDRKEGTYRCVHAATRRHPGRLALCILAYFKCISRNTNALPIDGQFPSVSLRDWLQTGEIISW